MLFPVNSDSGHWFYAGHLPNGCQALIGRSVYGEILVAMFDSAGNLTAVTQKKLPSPLVDPGAHVSRELDEEEFQEYLEREFGFRPGQIRIKEFGLPEGLAVYHLPKHYQKFLEDPNSPEFEEEERQAIPTWVEEWQRSGKFVLEWGNDYWLDSTGEVIAS